MAVDEQRLQTFRRAVHGGGEARRTGADDREVVHVMARRCHAKAETLRHFAHRWIAERDAVLRQNDGEIAIDDAGGGQQGGGLRIAIDIQPSIRNQIAGQEVLDRVRLRRPLMTDQPQPRSFRRTLRLPRLEQIADDREQPLLRWMPRLREVVVRARLVDRADGRLDVRVRGEQHPA